MYTIWDLLRLDKLNFIIAVNWWLHYIVHSIFFLWSFVWLSGLFMLYFRITWTAVVIFQLVKFIINDNITTKQVNSNSITANTMCILYRKIADVTEKNYMSKTRWTELLIEKDYVVHIIILERRTVSFLIVWRQKLPARVLIGGQCHRESTLTPAGVSTYRIVSLILYENVKYSKCRVNITRFTLNLNGRSCRRLVTLVRI